MGYLGSRRNWLRQCCALTRELDNSHVHVRLSAIDGLMRIGAPAKTAVPAIARLLKDPNEYVRSDAALALGELRNKRAIENLMELLKGEQDRGVHQAAVTAIGKFGPKAKKAIPVLIEILVNPKVPAQIESGASSTRILAGKLLPRWPAWGL